MHFNATKEEETRATSDDEPFASFTKRRAASQNGVRTYAVAGRYMFSP
jgi:hypothetical protein